MGLVEVAPFCSAQLPPAHTDIIKNRTGGAGPERGMETFPACATAIHTRVAMHSLLLPDGSENQNM